jgi:hypothetical protein
VSPNTHQPTFVKKFVVNYFFEEVQHMLFRVYNAHFGVSERTMMGTMTTSLIEIINSPDRCLKVHIRLICGGKLVLNAQRALLAEGSSKTHKGGVISAGLIVVEAEEVGCVVS